MKCFDGEISGFRVKCLELALAALPSSAGSLLGAEVAAPPATADEIVAAAQKFADFVLKVPGVV